MTSSAASARQVVMLARAPSAPGKTRLTAHLEDNRARALRERLFLDTLKRARAAGYPVVVSFTPETAWEEMRGLVGESTLLPQRGDDLGLRMRHALHDVLATGAAATVLIGSDLPTLPAEYLVQAFDALQGSGPIAGHDLVLGPSEDGGFYLVGSRRDPTDLFAGVEWGRADVLARVKGRARAMGWTIGFAPQWWDVDEQDDLRRLGEPYRVFWSDDRGSE